jgi:hypothetical protein
MKNDNILQDNISRPLIFFYIEKKGRKNSTPKATSNVTFSPDGA